MTALLLPWRKQEMSTVVSESRASVQWRIKDFPRIDAKPGEKLVSGTFQFLSATWKISMYPNEKDESDVGDVCLYLNRTESFIPMQNVKYKFFYRDNFAHDYHSTESSHKYDKNGGYGPSSCIRREDVLAGHLRELLLKDDVLTVCCEVRDADAGQEEDALEGEDCPISSVDALARDLSKISKDEGYSDVRLKIGEMEFPAHKVILKARSTVFESIFEERSGESIELDDVDESIATNFLLYLYSGKLDEITSKNAPKLFAAAHSYSLKELQTECLVFMKASFSVNNVCDFAETAFKYKNAELLTRAKTYFKSNFLSITSLPKWSAFVEEWPAIATEFLKFYASESIEVSRECCDSELQKLAVDLESVFENSHFADVMLRVDSEELPAHKAVLASRSSVFRGMFQSDMKENRERVVDLQEMKIYTAREMLHYVYTGKVGDLSKESALDLYVAGDRYDLQGLKEICQQFLSKNIGVDNLCNVALVADLHSDNLLKTAVSYFLHRNLEEVLASDTWKEFVKEKPAFFLELISTVLLKFGYVHKIESS